MPDESVAQVAIVDYGLGNLFSVQRACEHVGLRASITSSPEEILAAHGVLLPGVGAFGDAMAALSARGLIGTLRDVAASGRPLIGICLGMQLLMSVSHEFGTHEGLGLIEGEVVRFQTSEEHGAMLKVPQVGWNRIGTPPGVSWDGSSLQGVRDGEFMYFVHSFYARPRDSSVVLSMTRYGHIEFCSSLRRGNLVAFQFHPEKSGPQGLTIYRNLAQLITRSIVEAPHV